jgi:hypothetical protein
MKLTKSKLKEIIREELLNEDDIAQKIFLNVDAAAKQIKNALNGIKNNYGKITEYRELEKVYKSLEKWYKRWG